MIKIYTYQIPLERLRQAATVFLMFLLGSLTAKAIDKPVNFVVFLTDDQGWGDLGSYGHPLIQSPNIDHFAAEGIRFTQCYAASAICSPSRSAILTGRTPYRNGVFTWLPERDRVHLRSSEITIPTLLKQKGYETCHVGKWHLNGWFNSPQQPQPSNHGYDWWLATQNNAAPSHKNPTNFARNGKPLGQLQGYSALIVVDEAIAWLKKQRDPSKPFFLTVWTHEPHLPIESAPRFMAFYRGDQGLRKHHGNITQIDYAFGKLMEALDDLELREDTFVIYTSDNGPEGTGVRDPDAEKKYPYRTKLRGSTGPLRGRKRDVYEGGIRVPGIIRWPQSIKAGSVSDEPIIGSDIFTTVAGIAGVTLPKDRTIDGADMRPAFEGQRIDRDVPLYWRCRIARGPKTAMRIGDWKILANESLTTFELYNLRHDPRESYEVSEKYPQEFERMQTGLRKLNAEIEAEGPSWWRDYKDPI